jgi:D-inositol-3-phosphate glycosyltransferase
MLINHEVNQLPKKIAMISMHASPLAQLGGDKSGGMNLYIKEISLRLSKLGLQVDIFTRYELNDSSEIIEIGPGVRLVHIKAGPNKKILPAKLHRHVPAFIEGVKNFAIFENNKYDIIHSHYWLSGLIGASLSKEWNINHVTMFHTLSLAKEIALGKGSTVPVRMKAEKEIIVSANKIICSSYHEKELICSLSEISEKKVEVIPLAVDNNIFKPNDLILSRNKLDIEIDSKVILNVSRLDPVKGIDILIKAIAKIKNKKDIVLKIIGGEIKASQYKVYLQELVKSLNLTHHVQFLGSIAHGDLVKYYNASNLVVVPSRYESFGLVALEAFASGKPTIASNVGGLSSIINNGSNGFLVESENVDELSAKIEEVLNNINLSSKIGFQAYLDAKNYSWDHTAYSVFQVYKDSYKYFNNIKHVASY